MQRQIAIYIYDGVMGIDVLGPLEIFAVANYQLQQAGKNPIYHTQLISTDMQNIHCSSGAQLVPDLDRNSLNGPIDTLLIAGALDIAPLLDDNKLLTWLNDIANRCHRIGSICTGSFVLAAAGLLENRRATTHWQYSEDFKLQFPRVLLEPDVIYVRDGKLITSAGATAGMDLALSLINEDCGSHIAAAVAKAMVMFIQRPGGQSQFSCLLDTGHNTSERLITLVEWLLGNLDKPLTVDILAKQACMSPRNLSRVFVEETSLTPAKYINLARVEKARLYLEANKFPIKSIAQRCGFESSERMRRAFVRYMKVLPQDYRERFKTDTPTTIIHRKIST